MIRTVRRLATNPLLISQSAGAAANIVGFLVISVRADASTFAAFALYNILGTSAPGIIRAGLLVPAMIRLRTDANAVVPFSYATVGAAAMGLPALVFALVYEGGPSWPVAFFASMCAVAGYSEWLKYRHFAVGQRWRVACADMARLASVPVLLIVPVTTGAMAQGWLLALWIPSIAVLSFGLRPVGVHTRYRLYRPVATTHVAEFGILQLSAVVPMLTIGTITGTALITAVRFAQTLFGPLNVISSAIATHLLTGGAVDAKFRESSASLIRFGSRAARYLVILAVIVTACGIAGAYASPWLPAGVQSNYLALALVLVGIQACSNAWTGLHNVLARFMGGHGAVAAGRAVILAISGTAYIVAFVAVGADASISAGMLASSIAGPFVFWLPARRRYRAATESERARDSSAAGSPEANLPLD